MTTISLKPTFLFQNGLYLTNSPPLYSRRTPVDDGVTLAWDNLSVYANENRSRVKNKNIKRIISSGKKTHF